MAKTTKPLSQTDALPETKRSEITYKKDIPVTNLYALLAETEKTIQELSRTLAELPASRRVSVGGTMKLTEKENLIIQELAAARVRAERLLKIIEQP